MTTGTSVTERIHAAAIAVGFDRSAAAPVRKLPAARRLHEWLDAQMHGSMTWLDRNRVRRADPGAVVPGARSVLVLARDYHTGHAASEDPRKARISRYAWGDEYHDVLGRAVKELYSRIQGIAPQCAGRYYVDTGPVMEKAWAEIAGLGWVGKHTNLVRTGTGSWFFLAAIILDIDLEYGPPAVDRCGACRACIDACPTNAIVAPYVLDARRCISYLTIENAGPIPVEFRAPMGNRVFGCDDCQDVCPWNCFAVATPGAEPFLPREGNQAPRLLELFALDGAAFRDRFRRSPVRRAKHVGFRRNLAVALGNSGDREAVGPLVEALLGDPEELVRGHVAWALGELEGDVARTALRAASEDDTSRWVREEAREALGRIEGGPSGAVAS